MTKRSSVNSRLMLLGFVSLVVSAIGQADAGEMAFKLNKQICPRAYAAPLGWNMVALPWENPYTNAQDICEVFSLVPGRGVVQQIDPAVGAVFTHTCGDLGSFKLLPRVGVRVTNPIMTNGVLVGSFPDLPAGYHLYPPGAPSPVGQNWVALPYHTTYRYLSDFCSHTVCFTPTALCRIIQINACTGRFNSHNCGELSLGGTLRLGEAVWITITYGTGLDFILPHM